MPPNSCMKIGPKNKKKTKQPDEAAKMRGQLNVTCYTSASLPFPSSPYKYPLIFLRKIGTFYGKMERKLRGKQKKSGKVMRKTLQKFWGKKKILFPLSLSLVNLSQKASSIFACNFVGKLVGMGSFSITTAIPSSFYYNVNIVFIYMKLVSLHCLFIYFLFFFLQKSGTLSLYFTCYIIV